MRGVDSRHVFAGVAASVALATALAAWWPGSPNAVPASVAPPVSPLAPAVQPGLAVDMGTAPRGAAAPPGVPVAEWARLQTELRGEPGGEAELRRLENYLVYADALRHFRDLHRGSAAPSAGLTALALELDRGLPERIAARELSAVEAERVKRAVLEVLQPDPGQRADALAAWRDGFAAAYPSAAPDARQAGFERRQAEVLTAWNAQPPAERDPRTLERQLDALRSAQFNHPPTGGP